MAHSWPQPLESHVAVCAFLTVVVSCAGGSVATWTAAGNVDDLSRQCPAERAGWRGHDRCNADNALFVQWDLSISWAEPALAGPKVLPQQRPLGPVQQVKVPAQLQQEGQPQGVHAWLASGEAAQGQPRPEVKQGQPPQGAAQPAGTSSADAPSGDPGILQVHGVSTNAAGDLPVFIGAVCSNTIVLIACVIAFSLLRRIFPEMYANNVRTKQEGGFETAPFEPSDSFFGWIPAGMSVTPQQTQNTSGLDQALLLVFATFGMKLMAAIGVPLMVILSPLHYLCGGGEMAAVGDRLGTIGLNNISQGSWLFVFHSFAVWYVVLVTEYLVDKYVRKNLALRFMWLERLEPPRSTTLLVEGLPESLRSDSALEEFFKKFYPPGSVESACVVKHTRKLQSMVSQLKAKQLDLEKAKYRHLRLTETKAAGGAMTRVRSLSFSTYPGQEEHLVKEIVKLEGEVVDMEGECRDERERILADANLPLELRDDEFEDVKVAVASSKTCQVCAEAGFVTFTGEREALLALNARCDKDSEKMVLSIPPSPADMRYSDLMTPPHWAKVWAVFGYTAILGIFCSYTPFVVAISTLTQLQNLEKIPFFRFLMANMPALATMIQGFFSTLGIVIFMSFLPTILMGIFHTFFVLKANNWAQEKLQIWYFWFLVTFVLLITAIGASLLGRVMYLVKHPTEVAGVLADSLPQATHFYLNYMVMQWVVHGMNLTRWIQLLKFFVYRAAVGKQRAVQLAEPEDQEYYGVGARSARWSLDLILALVFCSITPLMTVVTFLNFLCTRVFYGYLVVFAETKKPDLGGPFFMKQMFHVQFGLLIYVVLMMGVFARRAATWVPVVIAGLSLLPVLYCLKRFRQLSWEDLPLAYVITDTFRRGELEEMTRYKAMGDKRPRYVQPELLVETWRSVGSTTVSSSDEEEAGWFGPNRSINT